MTSIVYNIARPRRILLAPLFKLFAHRTLFGLLGRSKALFCNPLVHDALWRRDGFVSLFVQGAQGGGVG